MQTIAEIMTRDVISISPQDSLQTAAQLMKDSDVGALPIVDGQRLVGMITDRDITIRGVAAGLALDNPVADVMTPDVLHCYDDQTVDDVLNDMGDIQTRRLPVLDHQTEALIGFVSLGDLSLIDIELPGEILHKVSSPSPSPPPMS